MRDKTTDEFAQEMQDKDDEKGHEIQTSTELPVPVIIEADNFTDIELKEPLPEEVDKQNTPLPIPPSLPPSTPAVELPDDAAQVIDVEDGQRDPKLTLNLWQKITFSYVTKLVQLAQQYASSTTLTLSPSLPSHSHLTPLSTHSPTSIPPNRIRITNNHTPPLHRAPPHHHRTTTPPYHRIPPSHHHIPPHHRTTHYRI